MAKYFDGKVSRAQKLDVYIIGSYLSGRDSAGKAVISWEIRNIRIVSEPEEGHGAVITNSKDDAARLYIDDSFFYNLRDQLDKDSMPLVVIRPSLSSVAFWSMASILSLAILFYLFSFMAPIFADNFPKEWEESLGKGAMEHIIKNNAFCDNERGEQVLHKITMRVTSATKEIPELNVKVLKNDSVNAFAMPGGNIVLYSGLIKHAGSAEEVAGVLAHELGHVIEKHPTQGLIKSMGVKLFFNLVVSNFVDLEFLSLIGEVMLRTKFSKDDEREADMIAVKLLQEGNINPTGLITFFKKIQKRGSGHDDTLTFLSTHPSISERIDTATTATKHSDDYPSLLTEGEWSSLKQICTGK